MNWVRPLSGIGLLLLTAPSTFAAVAHPLPLATPGANSPRPFAPRPECSQLLSTAALPPAEAATVHKVFVTAQAQASRENTGVLADAIQSAGGTYGDYLALMDRSLHAVDAEERTRFESAARAVWSQNEKQWFSDWSGTSERSAKQYLILNDRGLPQGMTLVLDVSAPRETRQHTQALLAVFKQWGLKELDLSLMGAGSLSNPDLLEVRQSFEYVYTTLLEIARSGHLQSLNLRMPPITVDDAQTLRLGPSLFAFLHQLSAVSQARQSLKHLGLHAPWLTWDTGSGDLSAFSNLKSLELSGNLPMLQILRSVAEAPLHLERLTVDASNAWPLGGRVPEEQTWVDLIGKLTHLKFLKWGQDAVRPAHFRWDAWSYLTNLEELIVPSSVLRTEQIRVLKRMPRLRKLVSLNTPWNRRALDIKQLAEISQVQELEINLLDLVDDPTSIRLLQSHPALRVLKIRAAQVPLPYQRVLRTALPTVELVFLPHEDSRF